MPAEDRASGGICKIYGFVFFCGMRWTHSRNPELGVFVTDLGLLWLMNRSEWNTHKREIKRLARRACGVTLTYDCKDDVLTACSGVSGDIIQDQFGVPHIVAIAADSSQFGTHRVNTPSVFDAVISSAYVKQQSGAM